MRVAVTGGTGLVGRVFVEAALARGDAVTVLGRRAPAPRLFSAPVVFRPFQLGGAAPDLEGAELLIHAALDHLPGRYRGGEGDDPAGFLRRNVDGTARLVRAARAAGIGAAVFLSSRAVYGAHPPGTRLSEDMEPRPDTLYGRAKLEGEAALAAECGGARAVALRATGVFGPPGPGQTHKWADLFARAMAGEPVPPRIGTEIYGPDLADAARRALTAAAPPAVLNVSGLVLDRRDLLAALARHLGRPLPLPPAGDPATVSEMDTARLHALGWRPSGWPALEHTLAKIVAG
ncbi:MAG: NAD-dependent epimerase/dehydratase family protein [Alphaproteobacteria bacterium]|jgi:nucleoside-diphosphate-sugar epimerase|nr:NAD-dependent epimerase/dehydratase family protein [Alphaproteobacteria bacterium]